MSKTKRAKVAAVLGTIAGQIESGSRSTIQPQTHTAVMELPQKSILVRGDERLIVTTTGFATHLFVFNETKQDSQKLEVPKDKFQVTENGFTIDGVAMYLERYGDADSEQSLLTALHNLSDLGLKERAAFRSVLEVAKSKGEQLAKVRDVLPIAHYRAFLNSVGLSEASARIYTTIAAGWDAIEVTDRTLLDAMKSIGKSKGTAPKKKDKPRLAKWEQRVVDVAAEFKVRGSAANLIRFLGKYGISEEQLKNR